jgi:outer membrane receptor protein involved in Fe transport
LASNPVENKSYSIDLQFLEQPETPRTDELVPGYGQSEPSSSEFWFKPNRRSFVHGDYMSTDGLLGVDWNIDVAWQRIDDDRTTRDFLAPTRSREANRSDLYGLTISASKLTDSGSWIVGTDYYYDEVSSHRTNEDIDSGVTTVVEPRFPDHSSAQLSSVYGNTTWSVNSRHALTAGLRLSDVRTRLPPSSTTSDELIRNTEISADLGWVADLVDRWQFLANVGYGFRAPNIFDLGTLGNRPGNRFNIPNTDLESERAIHGDLGIRYRYERAEFRVTAYAMRYRDRITSVLTGDITAEGREITQSVNAANSTMHGLEASARLAFAGNWMLNANMTYAWGEQVIGSATPEPADRIPPLNGTLGIEYDPQSSFRLEAWVSFADKQTRLSDRDISDVRIDPNGTSGWASVGARASLHSSDAWTWTATISNAIDRRYRVHGSGIDAVGRNLTIAVRYAWQ